MTKDLLFYFIVYINSYDPITGLHAIEHALIKVINPNLGGLSYRNDSYGCILVHGFEDKSNLTSVFSDISNHIQGTYTRIVNCKCRYGCYRCIKSEKCMNHNAYLDKYLARVILQII